MNGAGKYAECDGRPLLIRWRIDRHLFWTFEVDTEAAEALVSDRLPVVEVRPGVALLSVGVLRYLPGHFGPDSPPFGELVGAVHVAPDLSTEMPVPAMTFASFSVLSDSADFVEREGYTLYTPSRLVPSLSLDFTVDTLGVDVSDDDGPVLSLPSEHPEPRWVHKEMWGQHFTDTRGLQHGIWQWDGELFEHMEPGGGWCLHAHPFWRGLDPGRVRRCYRRMMLRPGTRCHERFYRMRPVEV